MQRLHNYSVAWLSGTMLGGSGRHGSQNRRHTRAMQPAAAYELLNEGCSGYESEAGNQHDARLEGFRRQNGHHLDGGRHDAVQQQRLLIPATLSQIETPKRHQKKSRLKGRTLNSSVQSTPEANAGSGSTSTQYPSFCCPLPPPHPATQTAAPTAAWRLLLNNLKQNRFTV